MAQQGFGEASRAILRLTARRPDTSFWLVELEGMPAAGGALSLLGEYA